MNLFKITSNHFDFEEFVKTRRLQSTDKDIVFESIKFVKHDNSGIKFELIINYLGKYYRTVYTVPSTDSFLYICKGDLTEVFKLEVTDYIYTEQNFNDE